MGRGGLRRENAYIHARERSRVTDPREIVRRELLFALVGLGPAFLLLAGESDLLAAWPVGVAAALATAATVAAADRLTGRRVAVPLGLFALVAVGFLALSYPPDAGVIGVGMLGLNVGWALNRLVFGVVRPLPAPRRRRAA